MFFYIPVHVQNNAGHIYHVNEQSCSQILFGMASGLLSKTPMSNKKCNIQFIRRNVKAMNKD